MDGTQDLDIQAMTGLSLDDCKRIAKAREDAESLVALVAPTDGKAKG